MGYGRQAMRYCRIASWRQAVGADYCVSTLREAVENCIAAAQHGGPGFVTAIEHLLLAVDASPSGQLASRLVGLLAGAQQIPTTVIHFDYEQQAAPQVGAEQARRTETMVEASADEADEAGLSEPGTDPVEIITKIEKPDESAIQAEASKGYDFLLIGREPASEGPRFHDQIARSAAAFDGPFGITIARGLHRNGEPGRPLNILVPVTETMASRHGAEMADRLGASITGNDHGAAFGRHPPHAAFLRHQVGGTTARERRRGRDHRRDLPAGRDPRRRGPQRGPQRWGRRFGNPAAGEGRGPQPAGDRRQPETRRRTCSSATSRRIARPLRLFHAVRQRAPRGNTAMIGN